jgi:signal peptidase II
VKSLSRYYPFGIAALVFALDRLTKWIIERSVSSWDTIVVIPGFFQIVHTKNLGAAFGIFADSSSEWRTLILIGLSAAVMLFIAGLLIQAIHGSQNPHPLQKVALGLVLGGALGNIYDRAVMGSVTDFLEFFIGEYRFPAFNVADSAITVGAGLLLLDIWRTRHEKVEART